ncbi:MAG: hypothetical protein ABIH72_00600 [archaeon]
MENKGQVWVETVIYTLIGLTIIGILLTIVTPKINETRDKAVVEQSVEVLNFIDAKINDIKYVAGNSRNLQLSIKSGLIIIDSQNDTIEFILKGSNYKYSEPGIIIEEGKVKVLSVESGKKYDIYLDLNYSRKFNITYDGIDDIRTIPKAGVSYDLILSNEGITGELTEIRFHLQ